ncbi:zinc finger protein 160-like [Ischnura elegans]|uniref:zinc finger protein 160-like n=1 Tax=Ischnura elegans TaxID=197161 RepID=UPI001ED8A88D|nr:zinc finger protein 160-like [Ischnura elegans]
MTDMARKLLFEKVCRLCGQEKQNGVNVLNGPRGSELLSKIKTRLSKEIVNLYPEDGLPKFVCTDCEVIVNSFSEFCNMVRSVQQKLEVLSNSCQEGSSCMSQRNIGCTPSVSISTGACITCLLCGSSLGSNTECAQLHLVSHGISSPYFVCRICGSSGEGFGSPVQVTGDRVIENGNWNRCTACNSQIQSTHANGPVGMKNVTRMPGVMQIPVDSQKGSQQSGRKGGSKKKRKSHSSSVMGKEGETTSQGIDGNKSFTCEVCARNFKSRGHLSRHRLVHSGERPFRCESCPAAFSQRGSLQVHQLQHSGSVPYLCPRCPRAFRFKVSLRSHILNIHPGENISINGMDAPTQPQLPMCDQSVGGVHPGGNINGAMPPPGCTTQHHESMQEDSVTSGRGARPSSDHACDRCGKRFATAYKLGRHYRSHTGERPFECQDCGRHFSQTGNLNLHRRIHHSQPEQQQQRMRQHLLRDESNSTREEAMGGVGVRVDVVMGGDRGTDTTTMSTCPEVAIRDAYREDRPVGIQGYVEMENSLGFGNMGVEKGVLGDGRENANDCILSVGDFEENIAQSLLSDASTNVVRHHPELSLMPSPLSCATPTISAMDKVLSGQTLSQIMEGEGLVDKVFSKLGSDNGSSVVFHSEGLMVEAEGFPEMEALGGRQYNEYVENVGGGEEGNGLLFLVEEEGLSTPMPAFPSLQTPPPPPMPHT